MQPSILLGVHNNPLNANPLNTDYVSSGRNDVELGNLGGGEHPEKSTNQNTTSLPIMTFTHQSEEPLHQRLVQNDRVLLLLQWTANYWPESSKDLGDIVHIVVYTVSLLAMLVSVALTFKNVIEIVRTEAQAELVGVTSNLTIFCGFVSVLPAQYINRQRLQRPFNAHDLLGLDECVRVSSMFGIVSAVTILVMLTLFCITTVAGEFYYITSCEFFIVMYLTFNMFFLLLDLRASLLLVDQLHILADNKTLTLEIFSAVRGEIQRRVDSSKWASDLILIPCVLSMFCFVVLITTLDQGVNVTYTLAIIGLIISLFKEIFFIGIAFFYVAQVNERADALTVKLSDSIWGINSIGNSSTSSDISAPDLQRISVYMSSLSRPISFTLLFKRLSWQNVAVSAAGFAATVVVGLVKSLVGFQ